MKHIIYRVEQTKSKETWNFDSEDFIKYFVKPNEETNWEERRFLKPSDFKVTVKYE